MIKFYLNIILSKKNLLNLINFIYLNLIKNSKNTNYFIKKTILISKNININKIFNTIIKRFSNKIYLYFNINLIDLIKNINIK